MVREYHTGNRAPPFLLLPQCYEVIDRDSPIDVRGTFTSGDFTFRFRTKASQELFWATGVTLLMLSESTCFARIFSPLEAILILSQLA